MKKTLSLMRQFLIAVAMVAVVYYIATHSLAPSADAKRITRSIELWRVAHAAPPQQTPLGSCGGCWGDTTCAQCHMMCDWSPTDGGQQCVNCADIWQPCSSMPWGVTQVMGKISHRKIDLVSDWTRRKLPANHAVMAAKFLSRPKSCGKPDKPETATR